MRHIAAFLTLILAVGCGKPFYLVTQNRVQMDGPVVTTGKIVTETPPVPDGGPITEMPLEGGPINAHEPKIGLVDVDGLFLNMDFTGPYSLGENPVAVFREKLDAIAADPDVCAVIVRINSPGGGVTATDIMWRDLMAFKAKTQRPVVACLMDLGTGGAYYLATAADIIVAHPTTITGGIGVIINLYNLRDLMAQYNVVMQGIKAGPNIDMGTSAHNLSPEAKDLLQAMADEFHQRFQRAVKLSRPKLEVNGGTTFDGRVFTAHRALERGLIDRIGYLDDAVVEARRLAKLDNARLVLFHRCNDPVRSPYGITPNVPLQATAIPFSLPGLDRSRLPTFLYVWEPEVTLERLSGK